MNVGRTSLCVALVLGVGASAAAGGERFKLLANDADSGDFFGWSCAVDGGRALVGSLYDDQSGQNAGAVYVYDTTTGQQLHKLLASDGSAGDGFGISVALQGTLALVGANKDDDLGEDSGSAYVFDLSTGQQILKLLPSDGVAGDFFGGAVALSGKLALVGAANDDDNGYQSGSAYVFDLATGQQVRKLLPADGARLDLFGASLALDGTQALIGAYLDDDVGDNAGSAYLFDVTTGAQLAKLLANDAATIDFFGWSVAIQGGRALVGAYGDDDQGEDSGAAYLFDVATASQTAKLLAPAGAAGDNFGYSVALAGSAALVSAYHADALGSDSGAAFRFHAATAALVDTLIPADGTANAWFGRFVALDETVALLGAPIDSVESFAAGSAYLFRVGFGPSFCDASDNALAACPCGNPGSPETGCDNAQATGGVALDVIEQQLAPNTALVRGSGFPPAASPAVVVLRSSALELGGPVAFGDGLRCVESASLVRLGAAVAGGGVSTHAFGHEAAAGNGTFHYQLWYRNAPASFCSAAAAFNLSNGVSLTW